MTAHILLAGLDAAAGYFSLSRGLRPGWELCAVCASAAAVGACGSAVLTGRGGLWPLAGLLALPPAMLAGRASVYFACFAIFWILAAGGTLPGFACWGVLRALQVMLGMTGQEHFPYELSRGLALLPAVVVLSAVVLAELARKASAKGASRMSIAGLGLGSAGVGALATLSAGGFAARAVCVLGALAVAATAATAVVRFSPRAVMRLSAALLVFTAAYDLSLILAGAA